MRARSATYGRISGAPSAQLMPTMSGSACAIESPERVDRLPRERAAAPVGDGDREPERRSPAPPRAWRRARPCVERVEDRLEQEQVDAAVDQPAHLLARTPSRSWSNVTARNAGSSTLGEIESVPLSGRSSRRRSAAVRRARGPLVGGAAREPRALDVHLVDGVLEAVVGLGDRRRGERVRLDDVGAGVEVGVVDRATISGPREDEQVVVPLESRGWSRKRSPRYASSPLTSLWMSTPQEPSRTAIRSWRTASSLSRASGIDRSRPTALLPGAVRASAL